VHVFVGPSFTGKTYYIREYLLPTLLTKPEEVTRMAPAGGFSAALIDDPPTTEHPEGQYPGPLYRDVAEWRRAEVRSRVARFEAATTRAVCAAALELGRLVVVLDDMERALGNATAGGVAKPSPEGVELVTRGRLSGCLVVGAVRRWGAMHTLVRSNVERAYFGRLTDDGDRREAAQTVGVAPAILEGFYRAVSQLQGVFLEWDPKANVSQLVRIENRRKIVLRRL
jgi:hypothetical protein